MTIALIISMYGIFYILNGTCFFGNHDFFSKKDTFVCKKCGIIKRRVRK